MFDAAIPVLAVTATAASAFSYFSSNPSMMARRSNDFPVPGHRRFSQRHRQLSAVEYAYL